MTIDQLLAEARALLGARPGPESLDVCHEGHASTLAAVILRRLRMHLATDLDGGYRAWMAYERKRHEP